MICVNEKERNELLNLFKEMRKEAGLSQTELAERLGLPQSFVSKYENGERRLDILEIRLICNELKIEVTEFIKKLEERINETK